MQVSRLIAVISAGVIVLAGTAVLPWLASGQDAAARSETIVWLVFTPDAPPSKRLIDQISRQIRDRCNTRLALVLLIRDFSALANDPSSDFQASTKTLREMVGPEFALDLYDERGRALAKRFGLQRLPAVAVERGGRVHVAYGAEADLETLLRCE